MVEVRTATARDRRAISMVLATAFAADPVIRWLMPKAGHDVRMFRALAAHVHAGWSAAWRASKDRPIWRAATGGTFRSTSDSAST
jgi:hypothetical protein